MRSKSIVTRFIDWFIIKVNHPKSMWVFEKLVYLWFLVYALTLFPIKGILYGPDSYMFGVRLSDSLLNNFFLKLVYNKSLASSVYYIHLVGALLAFVGVPKLFQLPKIIVFLTGWMFYYAAPAAFNGGYILMIAYSFLLIFSRPLSKKTGWIILTNLVNVALVMQLFVVYTTAAILKWSGHTWLGGTAAWVAAHYSVYQNETVLKLYTRFPWLAVIINYAALGYQTVFPVLVWVKRIKKPLLVVGLLFHAYTVFVMGIYFFGTAMVTAYVLFLEEDNRIIQYFWKKRIGNFT